MEKNNERGDQFYQQEQHMRVDIISNMAQAGDMSEMNFQN
jgi:hypothetical protein